MKSKRVLKPKPASNARMKKVQEGLQHAGLDGCVIENPLDLFYFTSLKLSAGRLLVHGSGALLLVDGRYLQIAQEKSPYPVSLDSTEAVLAFCKVGKIKKLGFDAAHTSYDRFLRFKQWEKNALKLVPSSSFFKTLRSVKEANEIAKMKKSAQLLWQGFEFIRKNLKKGVTEKELSKRFEIFCLERGADGLSFEPIIAFGKNSAMPHYRSQNVPLKEGDIVLIDIGVVLDSYHSDMTRVIFFKEEDPILKNLYEIVKRAQKSALVLCRPGVTCKELDSAARKVMRKEKVEDLFVHSLGHGIGLETHEFPRLKYDGEDKDVILEKGMVFTIEPGLYLPGKGGVRYEDTLVITANGYENFYPED
jgi:Xaa-Pro aminopeptidase